ncbi:MAG: ABC transporter ATP-binding protein [Acidimicrobiia bacterium]|nr:ABC transporter ATP-binding protein [Acidimicrobiia bacterium]
MTGDGRRARLEARGVTVRFGGLAALSDASVDVRAGEVVGLIGPNGAGKTTLFDVICGLRAPDAGSVVLEGADITGRSVHRRARLGIARTFQKLEVFGNLSAVDNVRVAVEMRRRWDRSPMRPLAEAAAVLERVGIAAVAGEAVAGLPTGTARLVELARALATNPRVLLLDEPSSGLDDSETSEVAGLVRSLCDDGLAVLLVEHDMSFVMDICERIFVLDFGRIIAEGSPQDVRVDPAVQAAYLGTEAAPMNGHRQAP